MNLEKLRHNLSFTAENKMKNLCKAGDMMNEMFSFLKFQGFNNELSKICFPSQKMIF